MNFKKKAGAGIALVPVVTAGFGAFGATPAGAWEEDCTGAGTTGNIAWHTGTTARNTSQFQPNINWSFAEGTGCQVFFHGDNLSMRVQFCSGGNSAGTTFTEVGQIKAIAQGVGGSTCFRIQWKPNNQNTAGWAFFGKVIY